MPFRYGNSQMGWGGGLIGLLLFLIFVGVVVWIVIVIARDRRHHAHTHGWETGPTTPSSDALKILNERFARGEIDAAEYTERRDLLKGSP